MECLERSIIQLDILEVGQTYRVITNEGRYSRDMELELVGCFRDHYLFKDSLGRKESFLKTDFFSGEWQIKGINPKKILREAAEKLRGQSIPTIKEGLGMAAEKNREELIEKCIKWLENHPGEELYIKSKYHTYNLDYVQAGIIRDTVLSRMKREGKNVLIEGNRPKVLVYRPETEEGEIEMTEETIENTEFEEESEIEMTKEDQRVGKVIEVVASEDGKGLSAKVELDSPYLDEKILENLKNNFATREGEVIVEGSPEWLEKLTPMLNADRDRKFLIEKAEELQLRVTDANERLNMMMTRYNAEIDIYQELLEEIQERLEA